MPIDIMMKTEINNFLDSLNRSPKTIFAYRNALEQFIKAVVKDAELNTVTYIQFLVSLQNKSPSTQRVYITAVLKFYTFCKAGDWTELQNATQHYRRKSGKRLINFNPEAVERVIVYCESLNNGEASASLNTNLEALRDRAFVLTLADTGLRISEACSLKRGDIDWNEQRCIIEKGDKHAIIRCSRRSIHALTEYLHARSSVEPNSRQILAYQP